MALLFGVLRVTRLSPAERRALGKDPLLYIGLLLILQLILQWKNAGGTLFMNMITGQYRMTPPPVNGLPFSVEPVLSLHPLAWFAPSVLLLIATRHFLSRSRLKFLLWGMLINGAVLAAFGLMQFALGWTRMFGLIEISGNPHLIASFDYPNHGGAFFYLLFAISIGLLMDALEKKKAPLHLAAPALLSLLFGTTALASLSRAAVLAVIGIPLSALIVWIGLHYPKFSTASWVNLGIFGGVLSVLFIIGILSLGDGAIMEEFTKGKSIQEEIGEHYTENRGFQIPPALDMVKDYPWFGVGGWGYRRFVRCYTTDEQFPKFVATGKANVHCDPVQFLAEHGTVGFGLMTAGLGVVLWPWRKLNTWRYRGLALMTLCGTGVVLLHSLIDLPFRCPTVLWLWLLLLAIIPMLAGRSIKTAVHT